MPTLVWPLVHQTNENLRNSMKIYENPRKSKGSGGDVEVIWRLFGDHLGVVWRLFGGHMEVIWRLSGGHLELIWKSFGRDLEVIWRSSGNHLELIWTPFAMILISCETQFSNF